MSLSGMFNNLKTRTVLNILVKLRSYLTDTTVCLLQTVHSSVRSENQVEHVNTALAKSSFINHTVSGTHRYRHH